MSQQNYLAIPPGAIMPGSMPKFKIYVPAPNGQYVLWTLEGNRVTPQQLNKLSENGQKEVFIDLAEQFKYEEYLEAHLENILETKDHPTTRRRPYSAGYRPMSSSMPSSPPSDSSRSARMYYSERRR